MENKLVNDFLFYMKDGLNYKTILNNFTFFHSLHDPLCLFSCDAFKWDSAVLTVMKMKDKAFSEVDCP